jgi:pyridoxine 4-oxidase
VARTIGQRSELAYWRDVEIHPGADVGSDAALDEFIERAAMTHHHPVGTCRMGRATDGVVDANLKLHGFDGLYVVDASVIPTITSGPVHASVLALAEIFASDIAGPLLS